MSALPVPAKKPSLFVIAAELDQIADAYDQLDAQGESAEVLAMVEAYFANLLIDRDAKLEAYAAVIARFQAHAAIRRAESQRLAQLANWDENAADRLKARLKDYFELNGITKIETPLHRFRVQANGGIAALNTPGDPTQLPKQFQRVTIEADGAKIRNALAQGVAVPGCSLAGRGTHLRIE